MLNISMLPLRLFVVLGAMFFYLNSTKQTDVKPSRTSSNKATTAKTEDTEPLPTGPAIVRPYSTKKKFPPSLVNFGNMTLQRSPQGLPIFRLPEWVPKHVEVLLIPSCVGGLNNQRASLVESLIYAKLWGIKKIVAVPVLLKLTNIWGVQLGHRYKAPYDNINVIQGPVWPIAPGEFNELFDRETYERVLNTHGLEVVPEVYGNG
eukprot:PhF_6_TR28165/c0_g1_i2/m.41729